MAAFKRTPVLIVTGYAAAGKTTLTNLLLGECRASALRVGVIAHRQVEEYGIAPHPIDETGVVECDEVYDFGSGCLCCSPSGELTRLLSAWAERLLEGSLTLDLLLLKAAPLASPLVFARCIACASGALADAFQLASIVAVVSPRLAPRHLADRSPEWQAPNPISPLYLPSISPISLLYLATSPRPRPSGRRVKVRVRVS